MAEDFDLIAEYRDDQGKGASRRLRREGKVPAIIYGGGRPPRALAFDHNKVLKQLEVESFYSSILNVKVGDRSQAVILKDLQRHPAKRQILHLDLQRIVEDEEIRMNVPIHFMNEEKAPGVRQEGGTMSKMITEVEVVCLPRFLPEYLEIDVGHLGLNDMLHLSDLDLPEGVEIPELAQEGGDQVMVSVQYIREEVIEDEDLEAAEEPELVGEEAEEEGDEEAAGDEDSEES